MLKIMILVLGWAISSCVLAEDPPAKAGDKGKPVIPLEILSQEEFFKKFKDEFDKRQKSGEFKKARDSYYDYCVKVVGLPDNCECSARVHNEQTDEFLFYEMAVQRSFIEEMKMAMQSDNPYRFRALQVQNNSRDSLNRRIAVECGVIDEATKKVVPFKPEGQ